MNENSSVCIKSGGSKTSNNGPLKNESVVLIARLYVGARVVTKINGHRDKRSSKFSNLNSVNGKIA